MSERTHKLAWIAGLAAVVGLYLLTRWRLPIYDDAFFFLRFANNALEHGVWAWNVGDGPVHGNTSQLYQALVTGAAALAGPHTSAALRLLAGACLVAAGALLGWSRSGAVRASAAVALACPAALATLVSGMETALVLALGAAFLWSLTWPDAARGRLPLAAALAVTLFAGRPDTALLTLSALALTSRIGWRYAAAALGGMVALLGLYHWGYGQALPLSFSLKSGLSPIYDETFLALCREAKLRHTLYFLVSAGPLLLLAQRWRLLLPAALFLSYQLFITVDVMGMHGRFFVPALPWLVAAAGEPRRGALVVWAAAGIALLLGRGWLPADSGWVIGQVSDWTYAAAWLAGALALGPRWPVAGALSAAALGVLLSAPGPKWRGQTPTDTEHAEALMAQTTSWRGLKQVIHCLGPELHLYHSEIGVPGVLLPEAKITDLGGLMSPEITAGADLDTLCLRDQPEVIFLPHRNYQTLNATLTSGECLKGYQRVVEKSSSPLWIRSDLLERYRCEE